MSRDFTVFERYTAEVSYPNNMDTDSIYSTNQFLVYIDLIFDYLNDVQKNKVFEAYKKYTVDDESKFMYIDYIQPHKLKAYVLGNKLELDLHKEFFSGAKALTHAIFAMCDFGSNDFKRVFAVTNDNSKILPEFIIIDRKVGDEKLIFFSRFYSKILTDYLNDSYSISNIKNESVFIRRLFHHNQDPFFQRMRTTITYPVGQGVYMTKCLLDKDIETEAVNNVYIGKSESKDIDDVTVNCIKHHILEDSLNFRCVHTDSKLVSNPNHEGLDDLIKDIYKNIDWYEETI